MFSPLTTQQILSTVRPAHEWERLVRSNRVTADNVRGCLEKERSEKEGDALGSLFVALGGCLDTPLCVENIHWLWPHLMEWDERGAVVKELCHMPTFDMVADMCNGNWPEHERFLDEGSNRVTRVVLDMLSSPVGQDLVDTKWNSEVFGCWDENRWKWFAKQVVWWVESQSATSDQVRNLHSALRPMSSPCWDEMWAEIAVALKSTPHHWLLDDLLALPSFAATKQVIVDNALDVAQELENCHPLSTACPSLLECLVWLESLDSSIELPRSMVQNAAMELLEYAARIRSRPLTPVLLSRCTKAWNSMSGLEQERQLLARDNPERFLDFVATTDCRLEGVWDLRHWNVNETLHPSAFAAQQNHRLRGQLTTVVSLAGAGRCQSKTWRKL